LASHGGSNLQAAPATVKTTEIQGKQFDDFSKSVEILPILPNHRRRGCVLQIRALEMTGQSAHSPSSANFAENFAGSADQADLEPCIACQRFTEDSGPPHFASAAAHRRAAPPTRVKGSIPRPTVVRWTAFGHAID
jgi:hypothetical protein